MASLLKSIARRVKNTLQPPAPPKLLPLGSEAPDFSVPAHDGRTVVLSELRGRKVVLWFYPRADTPGCTAEGCGLRDRFAEFDRLGVVILGASFDDAAANAAFAAKFSFPFPLLCDTDRRLGLAYGAADRPDAGHARRISYVIDERGTIAHAIPDVDPASHSEQLLALLR